MTFGHLGLKIAALVGFVVICLSTFLYLFQMAGGRLRTSSPYNARVLLPDAQNLVPNSDVRRNGVLIGRVRKLDPQNGMSEVKFEIEKEGQTPIYRDATAQVRTKTLVGESYIDINPGHREAGSLPSGAVLPVTAARESVPLERILNTLDPQTRAEVRRNMRGIGVGLKGHGDDLNRLFGALAPTSADGGRLMRVLRPQRQDLAALIDNTGEVLQALGERTQSLRSLAVDAKRTAQAAASRDTQFRESLDELPPTLDQVRGSVAKLAAFSGRATPVFHNLHVASRDLSPALEDLAPAARDARKLFRSLVPFLHAVDPLFAALPPAARSLSTVVRPLDAFLRQANPALDYLHPYSAEFGSFFSNVPAALNAKDALGYRGRVFAILGPEQYTNYPPELRKLVDAFVETGGLQRIYNPRSNPYPKAGTVGKEQPFDGSYTRVEAGR